MVPGVFIILKVDEELEGSLLKVINPLLMEVINFLIKFLLCELLRLELLEIFLALATAEMRLYFDSRCFFLL